MWHWGGAANGQATGLELGHQGQTGSTAAAPSAHPQAQHPQQHQPAELGDMLHMLGHHSHHHAVAAHHSAAAAAAMQASQPGFEHLGGMFTGQYQ